MSSAYSSLLRITNEKTAHEHRLLAMRSFAEELRWTPSYEVRGSFGLNFIADHLVVEHGLDNAATISFLKASRRATDLDSAQLQALLTISYNNLVEWHLFVSESDFRWVNNLADRSTEPRADLTHGLAPSDISRLLSSAYLDESAGFEGVRRSLQPCDEALIKIISRWKRLLKADYPNASNRNISALFNALILIRGCEDRDLDRMPGSSRLLLEALDAEDGDSVDLTLVLRTALSKADVATELSEFVSQEALTPFKAVDRATLFNLLRELYAPREARYNFNFALMSKHALSRIYERYVSILRVDDPEETTAGRQLTFVNPAPTEMPPSKSGAVYTPQFIAGFFGRILRQNVTPRKFRELRSIDPACGSGIFLRTLLELQCDPFVPGTTVRIIEQAFDSLEGMDKDPNAYEATRLSLALLHLISTGSLPRASMLRISNEDSIVANLEGRLAARSFGAVITNPPFIKLDDLPPSERETYRLYLGERDLGRIDAYLAFVRLCMDLAEPGGFVCLVLPQSFLTASNAASHRQRIASEFDVRCLVDLSAVPVFEGFGAYSILIVIQRRTVADSIGLPAQIALVTERIGGALQACLDEVDVTTAYHRVFRVPQELFRSKQWILISPEQLRVDERLRTLPHISKFMTINQGFITGADDIFIVPRSRVPRGEERAYAEYLPDRQIQRYQVPNQTDSLVFFPYDGDEQLTERVLRSRFPKTWTYLTSHRNRLSARKSVSSGRVPWWRPARPRKPSTILRPKIVGPHLMLTPRFAVDAEGRFAVSHGPFLIANDASEEQTLIRLFCAVLNSSVCNWHLRTYAPKYAKGYNRLEVAVLRDVPVPDLSRVSAAELSWLVDMVDKLSEHPDDSGEIELDEMIAGLYGFTPSERKELFGIG